MSSAGGVPRISVVMLTDVASPVVAAALEPVRDLAFEIVVGVDQRVDPDSVGDLAEIADRVVRVEYLTPFEANLAWLDDQASGDWIFHLDGDDVVGEALLGRLSTPGWDDGITHAYASYRWIWGSADAMLDDHPWWPDPVLRLIRNVPGIRRYPGLTHHGRLVVGDHHIFDEPLYHLDLVVRSEAEREAKVDAYELHAPGQRTDRGWSVNGTYYLPERLDPAPRTAPVPAGDARTIRRVLAAVERNGPSTPRDTASPSRVPTAAARRAVPPPATGDAGLRVLAHEPIDAIVGHPFTVTVAVSNRSGRTWRPDDNPRDQVGGRLWHADGTPAGPELRASLPGPLAPHDEGLVRVVVPAIRAPGRLLLELGLLQEHVAWHDATASVAIDVRIGRRILLASPLGGATGSRTQAFAARLLATLARRLPDVHTVEVTAPGGDRPETMDEWPGVAAVVVLPGSWSEPGQRQRLVAVTQRAALLDVAVLAVGPTGARRLTGDEIGSLGEDPCRWLESGAPDADGSTDRIVDAVVASLSPAPSVTAVRGAAHRSVGSRPVGARGAPATSDRRP